MSDQLEQTRTIIVEAAADTAAYAARRERSTDRYARLVALGLHTAGSTPLYQAEALAFYGQALPADGSPLRLRHGTTFATIGDCEQFGTVISDDWFAAAGPTERMPALRWNDGRGSLSARYSIQDHMIGVPTAKRVSHVVCHEVAHAICDWTYGAATKAHGPEFVGIYLAVVERHISRTAATDLRAACAKTGRYAASRPGGHRVAWTDALPPGQA